MAFESFAVPEFMLNIGEVPCAETYPDAFFPEEVEDENGKLISSSYQHESDAKRVCVSCPLRLQCLAYALESNPIGIWGGTTENERRNIKRNKIDIRTHVVKGIKTSRDKQKRSEEYRRRKERKAAEMAQIDSN